MKTFSFGGVLLYQFIVVIQHRHLTRENKHRVIVIVIIIVICLQSGEAI